VIRPIRTHAEFYAVEQLQKEIWSIEDREVLPAIHMIAACEVGAILLGAFEGDEMVGFVYGFPGLEDGEPIIHSDMLAVKREYRDRGLGSELKRAQRDETLARGIRRITWTFDPLQAKNAYVNLEHLGAIATRYLRDFYGQTTSPLHNLGTDRLWIVWDLDHEKRRGPAEMTIDIPTDLSALDLEARKRWREETRQRFEKAFEAAYIVTGFERGSETSRYLLVR
jgi:predicted GNAT superfamily acetyltransferase